MNKMLQIHAMDKLIEDLVVKYKAKHSKIISKILSYYGIIHLGNGRYKCVNKKSKFYGKIAVVKEKNNG